MGLFSLEHSKTAYVADLVLYGLAVVALATVLIWAGPLEEWPLIAGGVILGLAAWTAVEYAIHRFVLHGIAPFRRWHADHHARPAALLGAPTLLSAGLMGLLLGPVWAWAAPWFAAGLSLGLLGGYLGYALTHHAIHHGRAHDNRWLTRRKIWHAQHHQHAGSGFYGVTSGFWDQSLGTPRAEPAVACPLHRKAPAPPDPHPAPLA